MGIKFNLELYHDVLELRKELQKSFPKCFFEFGSEKPLKLNIRNDLLQRLDELSLCYNKKLIKAFMDVYTSSISYKAAIIMPQAMRIDLDGNEVEPVTPKARYRAKTKSSKIIWALDLDGYEMELVKVKAKLKEQPPKKIKKSKEVSKKVAPPVIKNKNQPKVNISKVKQPIKASPANRNQITQQVILGQQPIIIIKKKRNITTPVT